jgi:RNase P subunit RPR2
MLVNYSTCPTCNTSYGYKEITDFYKNPKPDIMYKSRTRQFRNDTRVFCHNCNTYFLPSLVISDRTPKNEVQFLCRVQTINAIEKYMLLKNTKVLTKEENNLTLIILSKCQMMKLRKCCMLAKIEVSLSMNTRMKA